MEKEVKELTKGDEVEVWRRRPAEMKIADIEKEIELFLSGKTFVQIAEIVSSDGRDEAHKVERMQVWRDINDFIKIWKERNIDNIGVVMAREMARLDRLEDAYWVAWERSLEPEVTEDEVVSGELDSHLGVYMDGVGRDGVVRVKAQQQMKRTRTKKKHGVVEFLKGVERVAALRFKLMGIGQVSTVNVNWRNEAERSGVNPDQLIDVLVREIVEAKERGEDVNVLGTGEFS